MTKLISTNPANNYSVVGEVEISTDEEIKTKVAKAQVAKTAWKELGVKNRIKLLEPIRDEFKSRVDEIAQLISVETGKPLQESTSEVNRYIDNDLTWFLGHGADALADETTLKDDESTHRIVYEPYGVAASIAPWNYPFGMSVWGIFPNLIAGNTVVFKISEECPLVGKLLEEIITNHNLPDGVFAEGYGAGDVGKKLSEQDINLLWFTGSTKTGKALYKTAGEKFIKAIMEMGGSNPCIVFNDVDVKEVAPIIYSGRFQHCGQVCTSLKRLIIHESIVDELMNEIKTVMATKTVGNPLDLKTDHGSLVAKRQQELLESQLQDALDKGAKIIGKIGLDKGLKGAFFAPTLLANISKNMRVWQEEVFGPVLPYVTFKTEKEAIDLANDTSYGLGARIITGDDERAERVASKIDAGSIHLNLENRFLPANPFGGYKNSGIGRERGVHGLQELCQIKVIQKQNAGLTGA